MEYTPFTDDEWETLKKCKASIFEAKMKIEEVRDDWQSRECDDDNFDRDQEQEVDDLFHNVINSLEEIDNELEQIVPETQDQ